MSIVSNIIAALTVEKLGRRNITFYGLIVSIVFLLITGGLGTGSTGPMITGTVAFILIYVWPGGWLEAPTPTHATRLPFRPLLTPYLRNSSSTK